MRRSVGDVCVIVAANATEQEKAKLLNVAAKLTANDLVALDTDFASVGNVMEFLRIELAQVDLQMIYEGIKQLSIKIDTIKREDIELTASNAGKTLGPWNKAYKALGVLGGRGGAGNPDSSGSQDDNAGDSGGDSGLGRGIAEKSAAGPGAHCSACHGSDTLSGELGLDDEGAEEAALDNAYTQLMYAELQRPEVYQSYGLTEPPKSFTPPDIETYARGMRIIGISG